MTITPAIILDALLVAVVVLTVLNYVHKGFLAGLLDLVGNLAALAVAWLVAGKLSPTVFENFFRSGFIDQITQTLSEQGGASAMAVLNNFSGVLPQALLDQMTQNLQEILSSGAPDIATQIVEHIIAPLVVPMISVVVFFMAFALCRLLVKLLVTILANVNRIPMVGTVNRSLGVVIGLASGVVNVVLILCLLWAVIVITGGNLPVLNDQTLSGSFLYQFFSAYNPFVG